MEAIFWTFPDVSKYSGCPFYDPKLNHMANIAYVFMPLTFTGELDRIFADVDAHIFLRFSWPKFIQMCVLNVLR